MFELQHGLPQHDYFAIIQPCFKPGGLDCSSLAYGIDQIYNLINPYTQLRVEATLICRRTIYADSDLTDAICLLVYGVDKQALLARLRQKYDTMIDEMIEIWIFKKN